MPQVTQVSEAVELTKMFNIAVPPGSGLSAGKFSRVQADGVRVQQDFDLTSDV